MKNHLKILVICFAGNYVKIKTVGRRIRDVLLTQNSSTRPVEEDVRHVDPLSSKLFTAVFDVVFPQFELGRKVESILTPNGSVIDASRIILFLL